MGGSAAICKSTLYVPVISSLVVSVICRSVGVVPLVADVVIQLAEGLVVAVHATGLAVLVISIVRVMTGVPYSVMTRTDFGSTCNRGMAGSYIP